MRARSNRSNLLPGEYLTAAEYAPCIAETRIGKHKDLLAQIVAGFGFNKFESERILEEVCLQATKQYRHYSAAFPFRVWISKLVVRKCIVKISEDFFQDLNHAQIKSTALWNYSIDKSIFGSRQEQMPLSFWVVYMLRNHIGFSEKEIAEILNSNQLNIRERLNKALLYIARSASNPHIT